jgi:hypothetical protein
MKLSKNVCKNLDHLSAVIICEHLTEVMDNFNDKDKMYYLIELYFWYIYHRAPIKEELEYCKDKLSYIFCDILYVLKKYGYATESSS